MMAILAMSPILADLLKIVGIIILIVLALLLIAGVLFLLSSLGFFLAVLFGMLWTVLECGLFKKDSDESSIRGLGWVLIAAGAVTGVWMAFPSGMARLSWDIVSNYEDPGSVWPVIQAAAAAWKVPVTWACSYSAVSFPCSRLVSSFLDAAQYTAAVPVGLAVLVGFFRMWGVPGFFRKILYLPFLVLASFAVFAFAALSIHFITVPLGVLGLIALVAAIAIGRGSKWYAEYGFRTCLSSGGSSGCGGIGSSGWSAASSGSSSGYGVESQNMFDTELKHVNGLGPDSTLVLDEGRSSTYGRVYVDRDTGKSYTETRSNLTGHPTELRENFL